MKPDKDLDYGERIEFIRKFDSDGGYVVLDNSAIMRVEFADYSVGFNGQGNGLITADIHLMRGLAALFRENTSFVFPDYVRTEYREGARNLERFKYRNGLLAQQLAHEKHGLEQSMRSVKSVVSPEVAGIIPNLERIFCLLSEEFYEKHPHLRKQRDYKRSLSQSGNEQDDEKILAQAFALTYEKPTKVVSSDPDFEDIYAAAFLDSASLPSHGVSMPRNELQIIKLHPRLVYSELVTLRHLRKKFG